MGGVATLQRLVGEESGAQVSESEVRATLDGLVEDGLMIQEEDAYLSLAIPLGEYAPRRAVLEGHGLLKAAPGFGTTRGSRHTL